MTSEQFVYWLQGKLEGRSVDAIPYSEWQEVKNQLQTVFHKVTPGCSGTNYNLDPGLLKPNGTGTKAPWNNPDTFIC